MQKRKLNEKVVELETRKKTLSDEMESLHTEIDQTQAQLDIATQQADELHGKELQLLRYQKSTEQDLQAAQQRQKAFNHQLISLALNLRRIHKGKAALGEMTVPHLKVPVGDKYLDLKHVSFRPAHVITRIGKDNQPYVEITLKNIKGAIEAPIEGGVTVDVETEIDEFKLTLGGPVAGAFQSYLDSKGRTMLPPSGECCDVHCQIHQGISG